MMATNLAHRLSAVEESEHTANSSPSIATGVIQDEAPFVCAFCDGTGMEIFAVNGARHSQSRSESVLGGVAIERDSSDWLNIHLRRQLFKGKHGEFWKLQRNDFTEG